MFVAPLYFQIVKRSSTAEAGTYLIPAPMGNTVGGLVAGWWIGRTRQYKLPSVSGAACSVLAFICLALLWRGDGSPLEPLLIFPAGFAAGVAHSACFIGLGAGVDASDMAVAASGLYLFNNVGMMVGIGIGNTIYQVSLRSGLQSALENFPDRTSVRPSLPSKAPLNTNET